jgi:hypothetical protein
MTRKHYIKIAKILNRYKKIYMKRRYDTHGFNSYDNMVLEFCEMFKLENVNFDAVKFIDAVNKSNE